MKLEDRFYTSTEVAEILGVSLRSVYRYLEEGKLLAEVKTATGRHRFTRQNIIDFLYPSGDVAVSDDNEITGTGQTEQPAQVSAPVQTSQDSGSSGTADTDSETEEQLSDGTTDADDDDEDEEIDWLAKFREAAERHRTQLNTDDTTEDDSSDLELSEEASGTSEEQDTEEGAMPAELDTGDVQQVQGVSQQAAQQETVSEEVPVTPKAEPLPVEPAAAPVASVPQSEQVSADATTATTTSSSSVAEPSPSVVAPKVAATPTVQVPTTEPATKKVDSDSISSLASQPQPKPASKVEEVVDQKDAVEDVYYYKSSVAGLKDLAQMINKTAAASSVPYAFTLYAGLSLHKLIRPFSILHAYVRNSDRELFEKALNLTHSEESNAQVVLYVDRQGVLSKKKEIHGLSVVADSQLKKDLLAFGETDLAEEL